MRQGRATGRLSAGASCCRAAAPQPGWGVRGDCKRLPLRCLCFPWWGFSCTVLNTKCSVLLGDFISSLTLVTSPLNFPSQSCAGLCITNVEGGTTTSFFFCCTNYLFSLVLITFTRTGFPQLENKVVSFPSRRSLTNT